MNAHHGPSGERGAGDPLGGRPDRLPFAKYHGAGNDFVCVDDRASVFAAAGAETEEFISSLCSRRTGVGADGLILLRYAAPASPPGARDGSPADPPRRLRMVYYNADGAPSSFCGNGARCFLRYAHDLGLVREGRRVDFDASDGPHDGEVLRGGDVRVSLRVAAAPRSVAADAEVIDTGSPHYVLWGGTLPIGDITARAHAIRYGPAYAEAGINVNFAAEVAPDHLALRTYERGVEAETLACGTGVTAAAISAAHRGGVVGPVSTRVDAVGGTLRVEFVRDGAGGLGEVYLTGPAVRVFEGVYSSSPSAAAASASARAARSFL